MSDTSEDSEDISALLDRPVSNTVEEGGAYAFIRPYQTASG